MPAPVRQLWTLLLAAVLAGGFYLLLIDTTSLPELLVLAFVAPVCGVAFVLAREQSSVEPQVRPWWPALAWRLAYKIPQDIAILAWEALAQTVHPRPSRGSFRAAPFAATADTPEDTGRRAVAETLGSVSPNTIVLGIDKDSGLMLVHQLRRQGATDELDVTRLG